MRHRLADDVVHRDEAALGSERGDHRVGHPLDTRQEGVAQVCGEVDDGHDVGPGDDQDVPFEHRPGVEEAEDLGCLQDHCRRLVAEGNATEQAGGRAHDTTMPSSEHRGSCGQPAPPLGGIPANVR